MAQGKRADAVAFDRRIEYGAGRVEQLELYGVEVGVAVAVAPPELRVLDREGELSVPGRRGHGGDGSLRLEGGVGRHGAAHGAGRVPEESHRAVDLHFGRAVRHAAVDVHVRKARLVVAAQVHRLVDAAGRQAARPVPAVAELRLAQVAAVGLILVPRKLHEVERLALGALGRDAFVDAHRERVFAVEQQAGHVELGGVKGVFAVAEVTAVQVVVGVYVDAFKGQQDALAAEIRAGRERDRVPEVLVLDEAAALHVQLFERLVDDAGLQQREMDCAGDGAGDRGLRGSILGLPCADVAVSELPVF